MEIIIQIKHAPNAENWEKEKGFVQIAVYLKGQTNAMIIPAMAKENIQNLKKKHVKNAI